MDFIERAKVKLEHWISHNTHHIKEYQELAEGLKGAGKLKSARHIESIIELTMRSNEILKDALRALEE